MADFIEKPRPHTSIEGWEQHNEILAQTTQGQKEASLGERQSAIKLRNEAANKTVWKSKATNLSLVDRTLAVEKWCRTLEKTIVLVEQMVAKVGKAKEQVEISLKAKVPLLEVANKCLELRDERRGIDLVDDTARDTLLKEVDTLNAVSRMLRTKGMRAWKQLLNLNNVYNILKSDLQDKHGALKIDHHQISLTPKSPEISLKPNPLAPVPGMVSLEEWEKNSTDHCSLAEKQMEKAERLCNETALFIGTSNNEVDACRDNTDFALRKRIHETEQVLEGLKSQKDDLCSEIKKAEEEINKLEHLLEEMLRPLKLAHTRLENRKWRVNKELCADEANSSLKEEVLLLEQNMALLEEKIQNVRTLLNGLTEQLNKVEEDIERKTKSLQLDKQSLHIHGHPKAAAYQPDNSAWLHCDQSELGNTTNLVTRNDLIKPAYAERRSSSHLADRRHSTFDNTKHIQVSGVVNIEEANARRSLEDEERRLTD